MRADVAALSVTNETGRVATSCRPATAPSAASCRRSASNTAIRSSACSPWGTQTIEPIAQLDRAPERGADRQAAERRCAKPDLRRQQSVQRQQVLRLGSHRRRHAAQCRRPVHRAVQQRRLRSMRCSASPISCSARTRSPSPIRVNTGLSSGLDTPRSDYVARVAYQPDNIYSVHLALPARPRDLRRFAASRSRGPRELRPLAGLRALRQLRRAARDRVPRAASGRDRPGHVQVHAELEHARLGALRYRGRTRSTSTASDSAISTTASLFRSTTLRTITTAARRRPTTKCCW